MHYKKEFVIPGAIVPGLNKPWDINLFMFPSLYHITALQREGLTVYNASLSSLVQSCLLVVFGTADSPVSTFMSGMVGHSGCTGCHPYCDIPSRCCMHDSHYYPAMNHPHDYKVLGCCHPNISDDNLEKFKEDIATKYKANLNCLLAASTLSEYKSLCLALGLCKQTIFSSLSCQLLPVPSIFTMDIMHLSVLNEPDLFLKLFTGKLDVYEPNDRKNWDWMLCFHWTSDHHHFLSSYLPYLDPSFPIIRRLHRTASFFSLIPYPPQSSIVPYTI